MTTPNLLLSYKCYKYSNTKSPIIQNFHKSSKNIFTIKSTKPKLNITRIYNQNNKNQESNEKTKTEKCIEMLKKRGVTTEAAKDIMAKLNESGYKNTDDIRKLLVRGAWASLIPAIIEFLFNLSLAITLNFYVLDDSFNMQDGIDTLFYFIIRFIAIYFIVVTSTSFLTVTSLTYSIIKFGANADGLASAIQQLALNEGTGIIKNIKQSVDYLKIMNTLNEISDILKNENLNDKKISTVENLAAYLTLSRAEDKFGFSPAKFNLKEEEAMDIAVVFSRYDENDDGVLQMSEFSNLCSKLSNVSMDNEEIETAMKILDTDNSGVIEFDEFVSWWIEKVKPERIEKIKS